MSRDGIERNMGQAWRICPVLRDTLGLTLDGMAKAVEVLSDAKKHARKKSPLNTLYPKEALSSERKARRVKVFTPVWRPSQTLISACYPNWSA